MTSSSPLLQDITLSNSVLTSATHGTTTSIHEDVQHATNTQQPTATAEVDSVPTLGGLVPTTNTMDHHTDYNKPNDDTGTDSDGTNTKKKTKCCYCCSCCEALVCLSTVCIAAEMCFPEDSPFCKILCYPCCCCFLPFFLSK